MRALSLIIVALLAEMLMANSAYARPQRRLAEQEMEDESSPLSVSLIVGANLSASLTGNGGTSSRVSFMGGAELYYFFTPHVGIFLGGHYTSRGEKLASSAVASASFVDIPFGIAFRHGTRLFGSTSESQFSLGGFYSIPFGNLSVTNTQTRSAAGIAIMAQTLFPVGESVALGFGTWAKFGVAEVVTRDVGNNVAGGNVQEWGIGLILGF